MKYGSVILFNAVLILGGAGLYYVIENRAILFNERSARVIQESLSPQSNSDGGVTVTVTPESLSSSPWKFKIVFDTHTGSLDQDVAKIAVLIDDKGNTYTPLAWEGDPAGGHHREGIIFFQALPASQSWQIVIQNVGGIAERTFQWDN